MTMTPDRRELYANMPAFEQLAIDDAFSAAYEVLRKANLILKTDDTAENLIGAMARYVEDSK